MTYCYCSQTPTHTHTHHFNSNFQVTLVNWKPSSFYFLTLLETQNAFNIWQRLTCKCFNSCKVFKFLWKTHWSKRFPKIPLELAIVVFKGQLPFLTSHCCCCHKSVRQSLHGEADAQRDEKFEQIWVVLKYICDAYGFVKWRWLSVSHFGHERSKHLAVSSSLPQCGWHNLANKSLVESRRG